MRSTTTTPVARRSRLGRWGEPLVTAAALATFGPPGSAAAGNSPAATLGSAASAGDDERGARTPDHCHAEWFDVAQCHAAPATPFRLVLGVAAGVGKMNEGGPFGWNAGVGSVTDPGPSWGIQAGVELWPWLALEARYVGSRFAVESSASPAGSLAFLASEGDFTVRVTAPLPWVHPYVFGGIGYASIALSGSQAARAGSPLFSSSQPEVPMGLGLDVPLSWHLSVGAEVSYHFQIGEVFSNDALRDIDGGDIDTFAILLRARL